LQPGGIIALAKRDKNRAAGMGKLNFALGVLLRIDFDGPGCGSSATSRAFEYR
jgi:hypothetical protein